MGKTFSKSVAYTRENTIYISHITSPWAAPDGNGDSIPSANSRETSKFAEIPISAFGYHPMISHAIP